jgi:hypothetical protein
MIIEAKRVGENLDCGAQQLFRYFVTSDAKYAILTNGTEYRFYTDSEISNKMDLSPFLTIDFSCTNETQINALGNFRKKEYDRGKIYSMAVEMKYVNEIKTAIKDQLSNPSDDFIRLLISNSCKGTKTKAIVDRFRPFVKKSINDMMGGFCNIHISDEAAGELDGSIESSMENEIMEATRGALPEESRRSKINKSMHKNHFSINYRNCQMFSCHYSEDKKSVSYIQFMQPFMEEGCDWGKREKRDIFEISSANDILLCSNKILSSAKDIDDSYCEAAKRKIKTKE